LFSIKSAHKSFNVLGHWDILSSIVTIQTLLNKVCYGFHHILATWCIHWSYPL